MEGFPLALELAAGRLDAQSVPELLAALREDVRILAASGAGAARRQASVEAVFESSWALLSAEERTAAARLSVFRGGFDGPAAAAVARVEGSTLSALLRKSFVARGPGRGTRFHMHALLRQLAARRLDAHPELAGQVRARHARFYLEQAARDGEALFGPDAAGAMARLVPERANLDAAWRAAAAAGDLAALDAALDAWLRLLRLRGPYRDGLAQLEAAAAAAPTAPSDGADALPRLRLRARRAYLHHRLGEPEIGSELASHALRDARALGEALETRDEQAYALWVLGCIELLEGRQQEAEALFREGEELALAAGAAETAAENAWQRAVLAFYRDERELFVNQGEALIETCRVEGLRHLEGRIHESLGGVYARYGEPERAEAHLAAAREIAEAMGDLVGRVNTLGAQAELALHRGRLEEAEALASEALARARDLGAEEAVVVMRWGIGRILLAQGDPARAEAGLDEGLEAARRGGYRYWEACALTALACCARARGRLNEAEARVEEALSHWTEIGQAWGRAYALTEAAAVAREAGALGEAEARLGEAERQAEEAGDPYHDLELGLERWRLAEARGETEEAAQVRAETRAAAERLGAGLVLEACDVEGADT